MKEKSAQRRASDKWDKENMQVFSVKLRRPLGDIYRSYARKKGVKIADFVREAIEEKAARDGLIND